ncbi:MAG: O-antigen ligase family protein [Opitutales bacterium]
MMETWNQLFFPEYRLDWFGAGPSSPNKTGAFLALLALAACWPALRWPQRGFWLSLPGVGICLALLLQTESRGGLVAFGAGLLTLVGAVWAASSSLRPAVSRRFSKRCVPAVPRRFSKRNLPGGHRFGICFKAWFRSLKQRGTGSATGAGKPLKHWMTRGTAIGLLGFALVAYGGQLGVGERLDGMVTGDDASSAVRLKLYGAGLAMIAAAPAGWGWGRSGEAYGQWYQAIGDDRRYLSLVNSHLTWLAEGGWFFGLAYGLAWATAAALVLPLPFSPDRAVAFALWVCLGTAGIFSTVLTLWVLWVLPVLALVWVVVGRWRSCQWPSPRIWASVVGLAVVGLLGVLTLGRAIGPTPGPRASPQQVIWPGKDAVETVHLIAPDTATLGLQWGHSLRAADGLPVHVTVWHRESDFLQAKAQPVRRLMASGPGMSVETVSRARSAIWLNPPASPPEAWLTQIPGMDLTVVQGGRSPWLARRAWAALADQQPTIRQIVIPGAGAYIPDWPTFLQPEIPHAHTNR